MSIIYRECQKQLILRNTSPKLLFPLIKKDMHGSENIIFYVSGKCFDVKSLLRIIEYTSGDIKEQCLNRLETFTDDLDAQARVFCDRASSDYKIERVILLAGRVFELMKKTERFKTIHQLNIRLIPYLNPEQIIEALRGMIDNCKTLGDHIYIKNKEENREITNYLNNDPLKTKIDQYEKDHKNDKDFLDFYDLIYDLYRENEKKAMERINTVQDLLDINTAFRPSFHNEEVTTKFRENSYYQSVEQILKDKFFNAEDLRDIFKQLDNNNPLKQIVAELLLKI